MARWAASSTVALSSVALLSLALVAGCAPNGTGGGKPQVTLATTLGDIVIELEPDKAPITTANFLEYLDERFYDGTVFHRVVPGFVIQGGGLTKDMIRKKTREGIANEAHNGLLNLRGTLSVARTRDVDSGTTQFFINLADNTDLDHKDKTRDGYGYAVFGRVVSGMDVVDKIAAVETGVVNNYPNAPVEPVVIETARRN